MFYFFALLATGAKASAFPQSFAKEIMRLKEMGALEADSAIFKLKSAFVIGVVDMGGRKIFVKSLNPAHKEDFVLAQSKTLPLLFKGDVILARFTSKKGKKNKGGKAKGRKRIEKNENLCFIAKLSRTKTHTIAILAMKKGSVKAIELNNKEKIIDIKASQKSLKALPQGCVIKVDLQNGTICEVLGVMSEENIDEKIILSRFNHPVDFSESAKTLADSLNAAKPTLEAYPQRKNLTHLPFCVIDPKNAKDHDDGIYFDSKKRVLYVAIADVSEYVSANTDLDKEAFNRGFSLYLPHKVFPMLPPALSSDLCSLKANELRLAFVWEIHLDSNAKVTQSALYEAVIQPALVSDYESIESALHSRKKHNIPQAILAWLRAYLPFVKKLKKQRLQNGYDFMNVDMAMTLDENGAFSAFKAIKYGDSHSIIEESMLLANIESAKMLQKHGGGLFRIHAAPKDKYIRELILNATRLGFEVDFNNTNTMIKSLQAQAKGTQMAQILDGIIIRSFAKAKYSIENIGHFGLGFPCYTHFTSPIRRYSDLMTHRLLKAILRKSKSLTFLASSLNGVAHKMNHKEKAINAMSEEFCDRKILRHIKRELDADSQIIATVLVIDRISRGIMLDIFPQLRVTLNQSCDECEMVRARIQNVNLVSGEVFAEVVELLESNTRQKYV